ncbi:MAG: dihydrodipicolinate synthase [Anaerocolumna sp.]|jgi:4-hydroxy-tetrahydrodipicolinate synthase|nr:dihydrodipicolinate synthase [Anaerocolumna sp.]
MFKPQGIIPPIITPFTEAGEINEPVLRQLVDHLIGQGVHGLFPLGTTGEFYALDLSESKRILSIVKEQTAGRVPLYAGANHITTRGTIELAHIAEEIGADALSVLTPMFISQTQAEIYEFYKTVAANTSLPVIIYNNKPKTNVTVTPETIARLSEIPNIVGVKDSTGDFTNTEEYIRLTRGNDKFSVLLGRDTLIYAGLSYGATGAIASCANVAPGIAVDIYNKYMAGDLEGALEAQFKLAPLRIACNMGTFPQAIKEGLNMLGFPVGKCLDPIAELLPEEKAKLQKVLCDMGLL